MAMIEVTTFPPYLGPNLNDEICVEAEITVELHMKTDPNIYGFKKLTKCNKITYILVKIEKELIYLFDYELFISL